MPRTWQLDAGRHASERETRERNSTGRGGEKESRDRVAERDAGRHAETAQAQRERALILAGEPSAVGGTPVMEKVPMWVWAPPAGS